MTTGSSFRGQQRNKIIENRRFDISRENRITTYVQ
jgi:hypothetical protein